ncbi:signal recognition particle 19 kDa protein [Octopus sinensis]|uniref:Signal recognition particle 19 kDa protein n=1 Tax=Octopus sinensis TaxID=2607531 RepID=A0A6P7T6M2_9MOLL|nr:signal recognition particle 19 kDa protein [Octopus sinensis]
MASAASISAASRSVSSTRPWNPNFTHSDRERWICLYPAYINSKKTSKEGRRIPKEKAVDNPTFIEIRDVCAAAGMTIAPETKVYPRELDHRDNKALGRLRIQLKQEDGSAVQEEFKTRNDIFLYVAKTIPKLKTRQQSQSSSQSSSQLPGGKGPKKKGKKGR